MYASTHPLATLQPTDARMGFDDGYWGDAAPSTVAVVPAIAPRRSLFARMITLMGGAR